MMLSYLENFIGNDVFVKVNEKAQGNRVITLFYVTENIIGNRLMGVDTMGIWVEGSVEATIQGDKDAEGKVIVRDQPEKANFSMSVLIPWDHIEGIFVSRNPELTQEKKIEIGF